jgi:flagellar hook protein FlgE
VLQFQNNFIPAQSTTTINYAANLPSTPTTTNSSTAASGTITALGGLNALDFTGNPLTTAATGYTDATTTGTAVSNQAGATITTNTKLSGASGDVLTAGFAAGDTITIDSTTYTFVNTGSTAGTTGTNIDISDTVGTLLNKISAVTGVAPVLTPGATTGTITLHTGTAADLSISATPSPGTGANALAALGFAGGATKLRTTFTSPPTGAVTANDQQTFLNESISGGAVTAYDQTGTAVNLQLRWAKIDSAALGGSHTNTWNLFYQSLPNAAGTQVAWVNAGTNFTFSPAGVLTSPATPAITIPNVLVGNQSLGNLSFSTGSGGLTQFASTGGTATINAVTQNGFAAGQLQSVAINNNGIVVGTFSNGQNLDLASVTLSHFNGTNYLKALDGGAYAVTEQSGPAIIGASGNISGSSLEGSNTDIASEFTKLIVTQQAYSANTKVITTANSMVQDLLNVLR